MKAELRSEGNRLIMDFAREYGIPFEITGKLLLATRRCDFERLKALARRAEADGVPPEIIGVEEIRRIEPFAKGVAALHVKARRVIDYRAVSEQLAVNSAKNGASLVPGLEVHSIKVSEISHG